MEIFRFPFIPELSRNSGLRNKFPDHSISKMEIFSGKMETLVYSLKKISILVLPLHYHINTNKIQSGYIYFQLFTIKF